jgi:hypothetical protein
MKTITFQLSTSDAEISSLIRWKTDSEISHVDVVTPEGKPLGVYIAGELDETTSVSSPEVVPLGVPRRGFRLKFSRQSLSFRPAKRPGIGSPLAFPFKEPLGF